MRHKVLVVGHKTNNGAEFLSNLQLKNNGAELLPNEYKSVTQDLVVGHKTNNGEIFIKSSTYVP